MFVCTCHLECPKARKNNNNPLNNACTSREDYSVLTTRMYSYFSWGITGTWHKRSHVGGERQAHDVTRVTSERRRLLACFDVPQSTATTNAIIFLHRIVYKRAHGLLIVTAAQHQQWNESGITNHVMSPELVTIWLSSMKRQHDK